MLNRNNPQVTKALKSQVGTSETICLLATYRNINEWLAGVIDGDGSFIISKQGYASIEITMDLRDEHALQIIKNTYGGSVKLRSGTKAVRYRLNNKAGMLNLISDVNGNIRNPVRLLQLNKICSRYGMELKWPKKLDYMNGWLSGIFDSEGTIKINKENGKLSISVYQKTTEILEQLKELYAGEIDIDRESNTYKWNLSKRENVISLIDYFKVNPSRTSKKARLHLIKEYYELKDMQAQKALQGTILGKRYEYFIKKWERYIS